MGEESRRHLYGLSIGRWHWLNCKEYANEEEEERSDKCGLSSRYQ
jgi:hypothetical protein